MNQDDESEKILSFSKGHFHDIVSIIGVEVGDIGYHMGYQYPLWVLLIEGKLIDFLKKFIFLLSYRKTFYLIAFLHTFSSFLLPLSF